MAHAGCVHNHCKTLARVLIWISAHTADYVHLCLRQIQS